MIDFSFLPRSSFSDFAQKNGKDDRFKGIEKMRERESFFNEFIVEVRRREKDEKQQKKEQVCTAMGFRALLGVCLLQARRVCAYALSTLVGNIFTYLIFV